MKQENDSFKDTLDKSKKIPIDIWFFFGFLLTFSLSVRKVIFFLPILRLFNEYSAVYIYVSDMFFILTILWWVVVRLKHNNRNMSSMKWLQSAIASNPLLYIPGMLVVWSVLSTAWSQYPALAFFRSTKLFEYYLVYLYVAIRVIPRLLDEWKMFHVEHLYLNIENCKSESECGGMFHVEHFDLERINCGIDNEERHENYHCTSNVPRGTLAKLVCGKCSTWNISIIVFLAVAVFQSIIAILQELLQHSVGFFWLKESIILPDLPGVAKIIVHGQKIIRAYGLMPHPNILGGFLLLTTILTLLWLKFNKCSTWNIWNSTKLTETGKESFISADKLFQFDDSVDKNVPRGTFLDDNFIFLRNYRYAKSFVYAVLGLQILALILTLSKSAILGLIVAWLYINVPRGTFISDITSRQKNCSTCLAGRRAWNNLQINCRKMFHVEHFRVISLIVVVSIVADISFLKPDFHSIFVQSLTERVTFLKNSASMILTKPMLGVGMGQFVLSMQQYSKIALLDWQFQPVHNVFLLIWSELGIIGLALFIWLLYELFHVEQFNRSMPVDVSNRKYILKHNNQQLSNNIVLQYLRGILLGFIFIMLFDHYFWDIQQGSLMLWMVMGAIAGLRRA